MHPHRVTPEQRRGRTALSIDALVGFCDEQRLPEKNGFHHHGGDARSMVGSECRRERKIRVHRPGCVTQALGYGGDLQSDGGNAAARPREHGG